MPYMFWPEFDVHWVFPDHQTHYMCLYLEPDLMSTNPNINVCITYTSCAVCETMWEIIRYNKTLPKQTLDTPNRLLYSRGY